MLKKYAIKRAATGANPKTVAPIAASQCEAEFIKVNGALQLSGLGRTLLFGYLKTGEIKSVLLRKRGARTGVRLVSVQSLREFLNNALEAGGGIDSERTEQARSLRAQRKEGRAAK